MIFAKFSHPLYITPPLRGSPWNFVMAVGLEKKLEWCPYQNVKKCDDMFIRFFHSTGIGQTDRTGKAISRSACIGMLMRDKNQRRIEKTVKRANQNCSSRFRGMKHLINTNRGCETEFGNLVSDCSRVFSLTTPWFYRHATINPRRH